MRKSTAAAIIAASALVAACSKGRSEAAGPTVSRNYEVGDFHQIEIAGPFDIEVHTGGKPGVTAHGSQHLLERTVVEVKDGKLLIHSERQNGFFHFGSHGKAHFVVTVPQLDGAAINGSGDINVDQVRGRSFEGMISGSGDLLVNSLEVTTLKLSIAGSGDAKAAAGKAQSAEYEIAGSGDIDAGSIATQQVRISVHGSGDVNAHSSGTADIEIMGSGDVSVTGGAKCTVNKHGSGDVNCS